MSVLRDHEQTSRPAPVRPAEKSDDQTPPAAALPHAARRNVAAIVIQKACREYLERKSIRESKDAPISSAVGCELVKGIEQPSGPCVICLEAPLGDAKPIADTPNAQDVTTLVLNGTEEQNQTALQLGRVPVDCRTFRVTVSSGGHFEGKSNEAIAKLFNSR
ncbi:hypothetical protein QFC22_003250 [Naganishia vaughanmartiniae]|uniref:Uncharacterized protein n=1 Tax=Naganishia vaughanmartiniae TaxID=1424756 RepID=A0ACC2X795_9TREE|nr:hypothetical protein QFC22_003250 [Naganishia vaughanmartiniae]